MPVMYRRAKPLPYYKFDPYILHVVAEFSFDFFFQRVCQYDLHVSKSVCNCFFLSLLHIFRLVVSGHLQKEADFFSNFIEGERGIKEFCNQVCFYFVYPCTWSSLLHLIEHLYMYRCTQPSRSGNPPDLIKYLSMKVHVPNINRIWW